MTCCSDRKDDSPCYECLLESVQRVHKVLALWVYDIASTTEQNYYIEILEALNGEQQ